MGKDSSGARSLNVVGIQRTQLNEGDNILVEMRVIIRNHQMWLEYFCPLLQEEEDSAADPLYCSQLLKQRGGALTLASKVQNLIQSTLTNELGHVIETEDNS